MNNSRIPAAICIIAIIVISLYSGYIINNVLASNTPLPVQFTLGKVERNVVYSGSQTMDIYIPNVTSARPLPLVIYVHGGGMTSGDKSNINPIFLNTLASSGYAVASINYRLAPYYKYPDQIQDVKCAIRYLRSNAQMYRVNGSEIFAFGTSAGGQLVTLAALLGPNSTYDVGPYLNESSGITAAVDMFGPTNLTEGGGYSSTGILQVFGSNTSNEVMASPSYFVTANSPPIMIVQGINDTKVPDSQSIELFNKLTAAGDRTQLILVNNMGHMFMQVGSEPMNPTLEQIAQNMVSFFDQYKQAGGSK